MKKPSSQSVMKWLNARHVRERAILLAAGLGIVFMLWLTFVHDQLAVARENERRNITIVNSQILEQQNRQAEIRATFTTDPNTFALARQRELREAGATADARLNQLYGELITPEQMARVVTNILQNETALDLVSFSKTFSEPLLSGADEDGTPMPDIQVFKHGLRLVFEGSFLETVEYLRSLERLDGNFFWEALEFELVEYPTARMSLDIYTLSTEEGWIGV